MFLRLSLEQMLEHWRLHACYSPSFRNATVVRRDGIDTDAVFTSEINRWYRRLLRDGPVELLSPEDLSAALSLPLQTDGFYELTLPADVVRVIDVRLSGWLASARIVTSPTHIVAERQRHPLTRATPSRPVAVVDGPTLRLYPASASTDRIEALRVIRHREGEYSFDDSLLADLHP